VRNVLIARNQDLADNLARIGPIISANPQFPELEPYVQKLREYLADTSRIVRENLDYLALGEDSILEDIRSNTAQALQLVRFLSRRLLTPVVRARPTDRLCLKTISWLHGSHPSTRGVPAVFVDGDCGVWPMGGRFPPIYSFPTDEQQGLLFQALYFHEFGHLLYVFHKPELDELVRDLQAEVDDLLTPASIRNDRFAERQIEVRRTVVYTWYKWAQELFCDAIGLVLGGPAFLYALSSYCGMLEEGDFYRDVGDLRWSDHPVTSLRIRTLSEHARILGLHNAADQVSTEWERLAEAIEVPQDYHGFFDPRLLPAIRRTLGDMLTEVGPRAFTSDEAAAHTPITSETTPVALVNSAWQRRLTSARDYGDWETNAIGSWLEGYREPRLAATSG
jgi:hypothetical protein